MSLPVKCNACGAMSTEADFCSSCGIQLTPDAPAPASAPVAGSSSATVAGAAGSAAHSNEACPKCSAEREDPSSPFCGTCGYNFVTKLGGDVVPPEQVSAPAAPAAVKTSSGPVAATSSLSGQSGPRMDITITVDFSKPNAPKVRPSLNFNLFDEESLIGRTSTSVKQTVAIEDEAISKRHALIVRGHDGSYIIRDLNSTNGTAVNGSPLVAGADQPLKEGDLVTLGEFTVITVKSVRQS
jgi:hypothetical protein